MGAQKLKKKGRKMNKEFRSILQADCDRLFKKFEKLAAELNALNKGISNEYLAELPKNERDFLMERALLLHMQFVPLLHLQTATSKYLEYITNTLNGLNKPKEENERATN